MTTSIGGEQISELGIATGILNFIHTKWNTGLKQIQFSSVKIIDNIEKSSLDIILSDSKYSKLYSQLHPHTSILHVCVLPQNKKQCLMTKDHVLSGVKVLEFAY